MVGPLPIEQDAGRRRVTLAILLQVFLRGLLVQAGFNPRTLQGPGWAFAMAPALLFLYPEACERSAALRRHLGHFNTHPYFAAALLGGALRIEERIAAGLAPASSVHDFRQALAFPLAGVGDAFFWSALRPACALLAVVCLPLAGAWSVAVFLASYNGIHLAVRTWGFLVGYRQAEALIESVGRLRLPAVTTWLRRLAAVLAGAVGAVVLLGAVGRGEALAVVCGAALTLALVDRVRGWQVVLTVLGMAVLLGSLS